MGARSMVCLLTAGIAVAQEGPGTVSRIYTSKVKAGQYGFVPSGHHGADFDTYDAEFRETVTANFRQTVWAYVESYENIITEALPDFSKPPGDDFDFRMARLLPDLSFIPREGG